MPAPHAIHRASIHRALPGDAALMAAIHGTCFNRPWDEAAMGQFIAAPGILCLIGAATHVMAAPSGILIARHAAGEAELLTVGVTPACRRSGLGRAMLEQAIAALRSSGATTLFLEVDEGNEAALGLYRSLGAVPVGRRPGYYESGANAAIFSLALSDSRSDDGQIAQ
jgi:[ribosomal protein S18]-alanine N-acetyltransferase